MASQNESGHQIRAQMIRLVPTKADLAKRTPIVLTPRDKDILGALHTQGFLTTRLIEIAFFPEPPEGRSSPCSQAYDRLYRLWTWSYVDRVELPMVQSLGGRQPFLYTLGSRGRSIVEQAQDSSSLVQQRRLARLSSQFVGHDLIIAKFWANLVAVLRSTRLRLLRWRPERELRARRMRVIARGTDRWLPFLPDASFEIGYSDGSVQCGLLEVDMGTLSLPRFQRKLRAFELAREDGLFTKVWGLEDFEVHVLTETYAREQGIWRAARAEVPKERWDSYFFATFAALDAEHLDSEKSWYNLENTGCRLLYPDDDDDGSGDGDDD